MNYLCIVDGVVEYGSTSLSDFAHYQLMYAEDHKDADVQFLTLTDEEYDEILFGEMTSPYVRQVIYQGQVDSTKRNSLRTNFDGMPANIATGYKNLISIKRMKEKYDLMVKK